MSRELNSRQKARRSLRQAEGYLELATLFDDSLALEQDRKTVLADLCIATLDQIHKPGRYAAQVIYLRGQAHRLAERHRLAINDLKAAWRLVPGNVHTSLALGWCFKRLGQINQAVQALQDAVNEDDDSGILHYNLACYLTLAHRFPDAITHLARSIEIDERFWFRAADESDFDAIRQYPGFRQLATIVA